MNVSVAPVRLVFNVDKINAIAVSSNWLFLTGGPSTVVRINLESPSNVEDIQLPRKHAGSAGYIRRIIADKTGDSLLAVTSKDEHFFVTEKALEFRHLGRLKGTSTMCASFVDKNSILLGTRAGNIVEVAIYSSGNGAYFKRDLKSATQIWKSPHQDPVTSILASKYEVLVTCGAKLLKWSKHRGDKSMQRQKGDSNGSTSIGDSKYHQLLSSEPEILFSHNINCTMRQLVCSPDTITLAAIANAHKVVFSRSDEHWQEIEIASSLKHLLLSNYYLLAIVSNSDDSWSVLTINTFSQQIIQYTPIPNARHISGVAQDQEQGTFWLYGGESLLEIKLNNEKAGIWKVLVDQNRFEEALTIASSHSTKSLVLEKYGRYLLGHSAPESQTKGAQLLGQSDLPLEVAALEVMKSNPDTVPELLKARLGHSKSKAQQVMLTSWMAQLGNYSFLDTDAQWDPSTVRQILKEQGDFKTLLAVMLQTEDIDSAIEFHMVNENWNEALELLRQNESSECVYKYASVLLAKVPRQTVESWMRMPSLDISRLLSSLLAYSTDYRGPTHDNQALRYLRHLLKQGNRSTKEQRSFRSSSEWLAVVNTTISILGSHGSDEELLSLLKLYAFQLDDLFFALRISLRHHHYRSAIYLYTLAKLFEDAIQLCLTIGGEEMYELAIDIASNQTTEGTQRYEELRKYLLRMVAQKCIETQGPSAAIKFIKLLRVDDLLSRFPDFDTLSDLAPEIVKSLEITNNKLLCLNRDIDQTLEASKNMQVELSQFRHRSVLIEPGEACFVCSFPLVTRKFLVFPCQHGFHTDCAAQKMEALGIHRDITDECLLCSNDYLKLIGMPLELNF